MKSGFVQLVVKRALTNKIVRLQQKPPRYKPIDSFKTYLDKTLPYIEQSIEVQMLKKSLSKIKRPQLRIQLINAYLRRLFRMRVYEKQEIKSYKTIAPSDSEEMANIIDPTVLKQINEHTEYDVGFYALFRQSQMNKAFKNGCFGRYSQQEYGATNKFGIQIRQESISISQVMRLIQGNMENKIQGKEFDWEKFKQLKKQQIEQLINDQRNFPILFMQLSNQIYSYAQKYRSHPQYSRVWGSSIITDVIANSILQNRQQLENSVKIAQKVVDQVMKLQPLPSPKDFVYRFKHLPGTVIPEKIKSKHRIQMQRKQKQKAEKEKANQQGEDKSNLSQNQSQPKKKVYQLGVPPVKTFAQLPQKAKYYCRTPSLKSFFLGGEGGNGRSMILAYLSMFGHKNGWIIINVPNAYNWTHDRKAKYVRAYNGLYVIQQHSVQWLDQFIEANKQILQGKKVNMAIYGKCDITGVRQDEPQPVPNIYYAQRKTYFNEISQKFNSRLQQQEEQLRQQAKKRLTYILKEPKNIYEIGLAGIRNPEYATCAMGEILRQVYEINDVPIIECVDSFTYLYRPTYYPSFRYYNDRDLWGKVPPYHLAHCRFFVNLDGHKLKNGIKVVAASNYPMYMHRFNIKKIMFPENYQHKVRNLNITQFKNAAQFNILTSWWMADDIQQLNLMYAYMLTQGNWGDFQQLMRSGHYY